MAGLGDTIRNLRRAAGRTAAPLPTPGRRRLTDVRSFGPNPGGLRMFAYTPPQLPEGAPMVVVLHGCGQRAETFALDAGWTQLADQAGFALVAPEQGRRNNVGRCFNWFAPGDTQRDKGEAASIAQMVAAAIRTQRVDPARVYVAGLSAGGAMTAALLATYPELFAGGAIIAGIPYGVARDVGVAMRVMVHADLRPAGDLARLVTEAALPLPRTRRRLSIWQGDADTVVDPRNAADLARQWTTAWELPTTPADVRRTAGMTRTLWASADPGGDEVELHVVHGLGHGAPLATGDGGLGQAGPFMLEAGVSSTLEIARFWGIA